MGRGGREHATVMGEQQLVGVDWSEALVATRRIGSSPVVAGTIASMRKERPATPSALPKDGSRAEIMRRVKRMSPEHRIELFE